MRGDGPYPMPDKNHAKEFSPRAWGWSGGRAVQIASKMVLPTCVGMVRSRIKSRFNFFCSPHVRGDGPVAKIGSVFFTAREQRLHDFAKIETASRTERNSSLILALTRKPTASI